MYKTLLLDRVHIEKKFSSQASALDGKQTDSVYCAETGLDDAEIDRGLAALSAALQDQPHAIQKARLVEYVLDHTRIYVDEHDYFVGIQAWENAPKKYTVDSWNKEVEKDFEKEAELIKEYKDAKLIVGGGLDFYHSVPDWDALMDLGFPGLLERARKRYRELQARGECTEKQEAFFQAIEIEYCAILRFIDRLHQFAETKTFEKAPQISKCLKQLRDGAPTNIYEAMQLMYLYFTISEHVCFMQVRSLGYGLDSSLYPFYKKDLEDGTFTEEEIGELLGYFMLQFSAMGNYFGQPLYLGGMHADGTTKVNELSYLILNTYDALGLYNPKIQIKVNNTTPQAFLCQALEMIRHGTSSIVFCNDHMISKCLMARYGITYEKAVDSVISGCYEYKPKDCMPISVIRPNVLKQVSYVLDNGFDTVRNKQIGVKTGDVSELTTFDLFYSAYLKQLKNTIEVYSDAIHTMESKIAEINPCMLFSSTMDTCMIHMTDALDGGIENTTDYNISGIATAVDALMAVHDLVYERREITLEELKRAIDADWVGFESLRQKALKNCRKYGNNDMMADSYMAALVRFLSNLITNQKNPHSGPSIMELHSALAFIQGGLATKATPDGRRSGDETSKNASPTPGADVQGVTALINSASQIDTLLCDSGCCLDIMLHPSAVQGPEGMEALRGILMTYMRRGGISMQFNIFQESLLKDAQEHPENYQNLQVRVCGWNVLWNNLSRTEQDAYIIRAKTNAH